MKLYSLSTTVMSYISSRLLSQYSSNIVTKSIVPTNLQAFEFNLSKTSGSSLKSIFYILIEASQNAYYNKCYSITISNELKYNTFVPYINDITKLKVSIAITPFFRDEKVEILDVTKF